METIKLSIPKKKEYISSVRLLSSSLSNICGFDIDGIEDIKVILSESCIFFMKNIESDLSPFEMEFSIDKGSFKASVTDKNDGHISNEYKNDSEMSMLIIESLSDVFTIDREKSSITFEKKVN